MIHLHCHSHYSLLCGASSPADLAARAASLEMPALALTDLNAMHGMVEFQKACQETGVRAIHGVELTDDKPDGDATPVRLVPQSLAPGRCRAVLLAKDEAGFAAICRLVTLRQIRPDFDLKRDLLTFLSGEGDGVFCLTDSEELLAAALASAVGAAETAPAAVSNRGGRGAAAAGNGAGNGNSNGGRSGAATQRVRTATADRKPDLMAYTGGSLRVLLATAGGRIGPVYRKLRHLAAWAEAHGVPAVAGGDVYAATVEDMARQRLLSAIRTRTTCKSIPPEACAPPGAFLRPAREMQELLSEFPAACRESEAIADQCRFQPRLGRWRYPAFPLPRGETPESYLWKLCFDGLQRRYRQVGSQAMSRLQAEINAVEKLGFAGYFLIVWDIVRYAAAQGMPSLGRGSAANSLISYLLGITHVDPLEHDLYFQRFLNPERLTPPDIDLDFGWKDRDQVLDYIYQKYGRDNTAMICNINRFSSRSAFREVAKANGYGDREISRISKRLPRHTLEDPERALSRVPEAANLPVLKEPCRSLLEAARGLDRFPRHLGIHAGGVVIGQTPLTNLFPLQWARKGILISQLDMYAIEDLGLVKIDILAQRGLAVVADAARAVRRNHGLRVDLSHLPDDDPGTRRLMREGETLGCFYVESPGMRGLLKKLKAETFPVVVAASSVIRPGPSDSGMGRSFVLRHLGKEKPVLLHPSLSFLKETYGVMIYQEDVMRTLSAIAGMSLAEADLMRRAMSFKGDPQEFLALKDRFFAGARRTGATREVGEETIAEIWRQVSSFAGYAFCKAHSASYAVLSFQAAFLKAHYPAEFMAAVLSNHGGYYSTSTYLEEARRLGLEILLPDINRSEDDFTGCDGKIRIGLSQVHGLSQRSIDQLLDERERGGCFVSLGDLRERVPALTEPEIENLIRCGACDGFELTRPELLWRHALIEKERKSGRRSVRQGAPARNGGGNGRSVSNGAGDNGRPGGGNGDQHRDLGLPSLPSLPSSPGVPGAAWAAGRDGTRVVAGACSGAPAAGRSSLPATGPTVTQAALFPASRAGSSASLVPTIPDYSETEKLRQEMEILHLTATRHPMGALREYLHKRRVVKAADLPGWAGRRVKVAGLLITTKTAQVRKSGELMKFVTLEDETALCEVTLFPKVYTRYGSLLITRGPYLVTGRVEDDHGAISVTAEKLEMI